MTEEQKQAQEQAEEQTEPQTEPQSEPQSEKPEQEQAREVKDFKEVKENLKEDLKDSKEIIAENLKHYMKQMQVSSAELCRDLKISVSTFSDWLNEKSFPRIDKLDSLASYFGVKKSDLIEVHDQPEEGPVKEADFIIIGEAKGKAAEMQVDEDAAERAAQRAQQLSQDVAQSFGRYLRQKTDPDLPQVRELAYRLLLAQPQGRCPLDARELQYDREIIFETYAAYAQSTGVQIDLDLHPACFTTWIENFQTYLILYHAALPEADLRWAFALELGAIYLNLRDLPQLTEKQLAEQELFALELLAPTPVVAELVKRGVAEEQGVLRDHFGLPDSPAALLYHNWRIKSKAPADLPLAQQVVAHYQKWLQETLK